MLHFFKKNNPNNNAITLNIDEENMLKKLQKEYGYTPIGATDILAEIKTIQPILFPLVEAWYEGEIINYKFKGISITSIMKNQHCNYLGAITWMNFLIKNPEMIKDFKTMEFKQR